MSHTLINCTCKNRLGFSLLPLLWYHSILRGSIDQKHAKTNEIWRQNSEIHSAFACFHRPPWLLDPFKPHGAWVKRGSGKHMFGPSLFVRVGSQISPRRAKKDSNIPSPGRTTSVKCPTPGTTKTIKSPPHALPPPPRRHYIDRCIENVKDSFQFVFSFCQNSICPQIQQPTL